MYRIIKHDTILFSISFLFYSVNDEVEPVERPQVFWGLYGAGFHVGWAGFGRLSRGTIHILRKHMEGGSRSLKTATFAYF